MRALLVAVILVVAIAGSPTTASAGTAMIVVSGDDIEHVKDLNSEHTQTFGYAKLGYRYERWGLFALDLWRWNGEFVVYEGDTYAPLTDEDLSTLGNPRVPWRYRLPGGLVILAGLVELAIILRARRHTKLVLVVGTILVAFAGLFVLLGLTWEFMIPLFLGLHHLVSAYLTMKRTREAAELAAASQPHMKAMTSSSGSHRAISQSGSHRVSSSGSHRAVSQSGQHAARTSSPSIARTSSRELSQSGQHAARTSGTHVARTSGTHVAAKADDSGSMVPSRPSQPIIVQRPTTEPAAPIKPDDSADDPKLLR